jgi:hypothetical protein
MRVESFNNPEEAWYLRLEKEILFLRKTLFSIQLPNESKQPRDSLSND